MAVMYCELCERPVEARRRITGWTHVFALLSLGLTYLAVPFYRKRCPICTGRALSRIEPGEAPGRDKRIAKEELERRLASAAEDLDAREAELERLREERDFYKDLRGKAGDNDGR